MTDGSVRPLNLRDKNRLRTRQDLLDAVLDLFAEGGLNACSMEAAARLAGASKTTAYSYFPGGVDEVLRDLYRSIGQRVLAQGIKARSAQHRPEERILSLADVLLEVCAEPRVGRFYMMLSPALSPLLEPVVGQASSKFREMICSDLMAAGKPEISAAHCAVLISGAMREAATTVAKDPTLRNPLLSAMKSLISALMPSSS
jgi:AcrR family transcriptional regulator